MFLLKTKKTIFLMQYHSALAYAQQNNAKSCMTNCPLFAAVGDKTTEQGRYKFCSLGVAVGF